MRPQRCGQPSPCLRLLHLRSRPETPAPTSDQPPLPQPTGPAPRSDDSSSPPPFNVKTVPEGGATPDQSQPQAVSQDLYRIVTNVNQVMVPVTVKDESGRLVTRPDFQRLPGTGKRREAEHEFLHR